MAPLKPNTKKLLYQLLKPWSTNFLAVIKILYASGVDSRLFDKWYKTNISLPGYLQWQEGYGPQTYPITVTLPNGDKQGPYLKRVKYIGPGSNSAIQGKAYRDSGDALADKNALIKYQTDQLNLLRGLRAELTGILPIALGPGGAALVLAEFDKFLTIMQNALEVAKTKPPPSL